MKERLARLRARYPAVDHLILMQEHYGAVKASQQAGAVTYFAFLSFFPVLALGFFVVGVISSVYPDADENLRSAIESVLPHLIGSSEGQLSLDDIRTFSGWAGLIGLAGVLYSGLGWLSALRDALTVVFETPAGEQPGFVMGKLRDLLALSVLGAVLLIAVPVAGFVAGFSDDILSALRVSAELGWLVYLLTLVLGIAANALLFFAMFRLLGTREVPTRSLWQGAALGAVGFELLKQVAKYLFASTQGQPAFQAFGIALILLVWINYFTRVVLYSASWAYTTAEARAVRPAPEPDPVQGPPMPSGADAPMATVAAPRPWVAPFSAGAGAMLAFVGVVRRLTRR